MQQPPANPTIPTQQYKVLNVFTAGERNGHTQYLGAPACWSYAFSCCENLKDSLFSWVGVGDCAPMQGPQGAEPPALNNVVIDSVYIMYILQCSFPGIFHALPCYQCYDSR